MSYSQCYSGPYSYRLDDRYYMVNLFDTHQQSIKKTKSLHVMMGCYTTGFQKGTETTGTTNAYQSYKACLDACTMLHFASLLFSKRSGIPMLFLEKSTKMASMQYAHSVANGPLNVVFALVLRADCLVPINKPRDTYETQKKGTSMENHDL